MEIPSSSTLVAPPGFGDSPLWSVPFVSTPHVVDDGFVGVLDTSSDSVRVQVLDDTGTLRFGVDVPKDRAQFAVTSVRDRELLVTEDIDTTDSGNAASLTARDTRTGDVVWGPVGTAGCLTGMGLLIDAGCNGESARAEAAVSAVDGHSTELSGALSESDGYAVVRDGVHARIVTVDTGNTAWSTATLTPPPAALAGTARFVGAAGNSVAVAWTIPTRPEPIQAVYRLSDAELRWVSGALTPMNVTADASTGSTLITTGDLGDDGIAVLFEQYGTRGFTTDQFPGAEQFTIVGGIVYGTAKSSVTAIDSVSGRVTGTSSGPVPIAMTSNGVALTADSGGHTAFKVIPHF
ncbi:putative uncharacterized protein [Rhodococcus sp. AW25M09]|nr:putative uncharacterized protein [Rhodococcus sp. AW25M09]